MSSLEKRPGRAGHCLQLRVVALAILLLAGPACAQTRAAESMDVFSFTEFEPLVGEYPSRMLLTERWLRFDDDKDEGDYVLFDRETGLVTSVSHDQRSLFDIHPRPAHLQLPADIDFEVEQRPAADGRRFRDRAVVSLRFLAAGRACAGAEVVAGWNPQARSALLAYARALAVNNAADLAKTPAELRTGCFYVEHLIWRKRALEAGFPLVLWRADGRRRTLQAHRQQPLNPALFRLPAYPRYSFSEPSAGG